MAEKQNGSTPHETPLPLTLGYTDTDGPGPCTFTILYGPYESRLSGSGANRTYTPNRGYNGPDSFTWKVREGIADSNSATYSLAVSPSRPEDH